MPLLGQTVAPIIAFIFSAWMIAIQYCDYPFDNHKIAFSRMRNALAQNKWMNYSFGTLVTLFTMIPFLNLVVMPVAVCGATAMWVGEYRNFFLNNPTDEFTGADYTFSKANGSAVSPHVKGREVRQSSNDIRS